ncbi:hypothetical protein JZ751_005982, partial [Albula glossodonta]
MAWVHRPPEKVVSGGEFSVTYSVTASEDFYQWAIDNMVFTHSSISDAAAAKRFCEEHECPQNWKDANGENCCIHHANIHSCPMGFMVVHFYPRSIWKSSSECSPTLHCVLKAFSPRPTLKNTLVVLFHVGVTSLIAHIRVGNMQVALEAKSMVLPAIGTRTSITSYTKSLIISPQ